MRGLSGWFGAASGVWSMWTVSLLRTALGQKEPVEGILEIRGDSLTVLRCSRRSAGCFQYPLSQIIL